MRVPHLMPLLCCTLLVAGCDDAVAPAPPLRGTPPQLARTTPMGFVLTSVDAGSGSACGLDGGGRAYCWGNPYALGNNTLTSSPVPIPLPPPSGSTTPLAFTSVSVGSWHACGIAKGGQVYCWGSGSEMGLGSTPPTGYPQAIAPPAGSATPLTFISLSAGTFFTCGVAKGGQAYCWGGNDQGQLGIGTTDPVVNVPTPVAPPAGATTPLTFTSVSAATNMGFACGVARGGLAYCWGNNFKGQLGNGSTVSGSNVPVPVAPPAGFTAPLTFTSLSAGAHHICGLTTGAHIYCWGYDGFGALGDGSSELGDYSNIPVPVLSGATFISVSGGYDFTCGVTRSGQAYCWGANGFGQLGNGTLIDTNVPMPVSGGFTFTFLSAGNAHTCGVAGKLGTFCWGSNTAGALGNGLEPTPSYGPYPVSNP